MKSARSLTSSNNSTRKHLTYEKLGYMIRMNKEITNEIINGKIERMTKGRNKW